MGRFIVVDPALVDFQGHHAAYSDAVATAADAAGLSAVILANERCRLGSAQAETSILRAFRDTQYDAERSAWAWREDLVLALARLEPTRDDHVFVHTMLPRELDQLVGAIVAGDVSPEPAYHLLFRRDFEEHDPYERLVVREFFRNVGDDERFRRFHFYTDTRQLSEQHDELADQAGRRFVTLPIPVRDDGTPTAATTRPAGDPVTVTYLGDARPEKGYQHLPNAVRELLADVPAGSVRVLAQSNFNLPGGEPGMAEARSELAAWRNRGVQLLHGPLEPADYDSLLAESDIVVVPYDRERYQRRSSGILAEAIRAGKVAVVPEGTWLASECDAARAVTYDDPSGLGRALRQAVRDVDALSEAARAFAPTYRERCSPERLVETLIERARGDDRESAPGPIAATERPRVLWIMPAHSVLTGGRTGAGRVAEAQLRFLSRQGFEVHALIAGDCTWQGGPWYGLQEERAREFLARFGVTKSWYATLPAPWFFEGRPESFDMQRLRAEAMGGHASFDHDERMRRLYVVPEPLREECRNGGYSFALVNYAYNCTLLDTLGLTETPVACEMHDVMARQYAFRRKSAVDEADLARERGVLQECQAVLCINAKEREELERELDGPAFFDSVPPLPAAPVDVEALAGATSLGDVVRSAGPLVKNADELVESLADETAFDLLFVSSNHAPNIASLRWFHDEVYRPHLEPAGVGVVVVGDISIARPVPTRPGFRFTGPLEDLTPAYAAAKVVVVPLIQGAGTSIKTLEALSRGKPLVGTPLAFRGLSGTGLSFDSLTATSARALAERSLTLLSDERQRREAAREVRALAEVVGDARRYDASLGRAVQCLLPDFEPAIASPSSEVAEAGELVELSSELVRFNRYLRSHAAGDEVAPTDRDALLRDLTDEPFRATCERLLAAWRSSGAGERGFASLDELLDALRAGSGRAVALATSG